MNEIFKKVRPLDYVLAVLLTGLGAWAMSANINAEPSDIKPGELSHWYDAQSVWVLVLWVAVTAPILWRRRSMAVVVLVTAAAVGVHVALFGWSVRCGSGLPVSFALAYGVGRLSGRRELLPAFLGVVGVQFLVLVRDSAAGLEIIPATAGIALVLAALGYGVRQINEKKTVRDERPLVAA